MKNANALTRNGQGELIPHPDTKPISTSAPRYGLGARNAQGQYVEHPDSKPVGKTPQHALLAQFAPGFAAKQRASS